MPRHARETISGRITVQGDATNLAIGSQMTQTSYRVEGQRAAQEIAQHLADVESALGALKPKLDPGSASMAEFNLDLLKAELTKTGNKDTPSATTITRIGDWLLENLPELAGELTGLFTAPAVGKVVATAGSLAMSWVRERFGPPSSAPPDA
jgi:hypothetical protein